MHGAIRFSEQPPGTAPPFTIKEAGVLLSDDRSRAPMVENEHRIGQAVASGAGGRYRNSRSEGGASGTFGKSLESASP
jgi:hypothetical protein